MFVPRQIQTKAFHQRLGELAPPPTPGKLNKDGRIDPTLAKEMVMALEILLSDYGIENGPPEWFLERMRAVEGKGDFIHLSALLDCALLAEMKPKPSQVTLQRALVQCPSDSLEQSKDRYYIRRRRGYLPPSKSPASRDHLEDCTIYIEPHVTGITLNPGRIARMLSQSAMPRKYLPVQFVEAGDTAWAFVILSTMVSRGDAEDQKLWPKDWMILTKREWRRRDEEYQQLRRRRPTFPLHTRLPAPERHDVDSGSSAQRRWPDRPIAPTVHADLVSTQADDAGMGVNYELGLIVYLTNLHPATNKETISSFIKRQVDRYNQKKSSFTTKNNLVATGEDSLPMGINYVDYQKGVTTAYLRLQRRRDSDLVISALEKRKRRMRDGNDAKGRKAVKVQGEDEWVGATILGGDEERIYWEKVLALRGKGRGKGRKRKSPSLPATSDVHPPYKHEQKGAKEFSKKIKFAS